MYEKEILFMLSLCVVLIAVIGIIVFLKNLFSTGEVHMTGKDVDRVIDYMHDNDLKSCKLSLSKNEIEISSDEISVVRKFNRKS
ncbi:hypothetical protein [Bacillus pseudomycoides]|uniref:hypothetical protein n=1 Tax=Bacillus pseudomycoides TaxID=64104 RepID=UPI000BF47D2F|nr:hypothetical protein [Bacillus pseudomycoides]PGA76483.1 hypothetical protein COL87_01300 [Bacillus pseudomycoides]PHE92345.1 hypothetical protein COF78_17255 [Bacillus pseudomycoides]